MTEEVEKKPNILYPAYINKTKTVANGRRVPQHIAVDNPKPNEVVEALRGLKGFEVSAEGKPYCRELNKEAFPWRVRYKNIDPSKNNLNNKRQILIACAKRINEVRAKSSQQTNNTSEASGKQKKKK